MVLCQTSKQCVSQTLFMIWTQSEIAKNVTMSLKPLFIAVVLATVPFNIFVNLIVDSA
jgi:hypothetical protein